MPRLIVLSLLALSLCVASLTGNRALRAEDSQNRSKPQKYLRITRDDDKKPRSLETAVVSYVPKTGDRPVTVDLVSAIHIGDDEYFNSLNRLFKEYDVVLYEMVKPKDVKPVRGFRDREPNPLAVLQRMLPSMLDLEFQVDSIDYSPKNFVHADLTPKQLAAAMEKRGETGMTLTIKALMEILQKYQSEWSQDGRLGGNISDAELLSMLTRKGGARQMKEMLADKLAELGPNISLGGTLDAILIADRNEAALKELGRQLKQRDDGKPLRIAIYYGAAHMPDMAAQLTKRFDMKPGPVKWVQAWDIRRESKTSVLEGLLQLLQEVQ